MFSFPAYVLIGDDRTGKTNFQKFLISTLCRRSFTRLPRNLVLDIVHPRMPRGCGKFMSMNRSFQEKRDEYIDIDFYFNNIFKDADICVLSSHTHDPSIDDLRKMIARLKTRCYNPKAVFFSNGYNAYAELISLLDWEERLWIDNPQRDSEEEFLEQIRYLAEEFANLLIARAHVA